MHRTATNACLPLCAPARRYSPCGAGQGTCCETLSGNLHKIGFSVSVWEQRCGQGTAEVIGTAVDDEQRQRRCRT